MSNFIKTNNNVRKIYQLFLRRLGVSCSNEGKWSTIDQHAGDVIKTRVCLRDERKEKAFCCSLRRSSLAGQCEATCRIFIFNMNMWLPAPLSSATPSRLSEYFLSHQQQSSKGNTKCHQKRKQSLRWLFTCWFLERTPVGLSCPERPCERLKCSPAPLLWCSPADWGSPTRRFLPSLWARAHVNTRDARGSSGSGCKLPDLVRKRKRAIERRGWCRRGRCVECVRLTGTPIWVRLVAILVAD